MRLNSSMVRPAIAVALVIVIGGLFMWREVLSDDGSAAGDGQTALGIAEQSLAVEVGAPAPDRIDVPPARASASAGFSRNSPMRPLSSTRTAPKAEISSPEQGSTATVTSAPVSTCRAMSAA